MEPSINCHDLFVRLGDDEILIVDCCEGKEKGVCTEQIPGALWIGFEELAECAHILPDDELIVVCGCAPDGSDSRRASRLLWMRGREAICLQGGLPAWIIAGYPTEPYVPCSERVARKRTGEVAVAVGGD